MPFASRAMARTSCLSERLARVNRGGGDEESKRVNKDLEEEHAGMSTDGAGSSGELGGTVPRSPAATA